MPRRRRKKQNQKIEEPNLLDLLGEWIDPDIAAIILDYAVDFYQLQPIEKQPTLFLPPFAIDNSFIEYYKRATGNDLLDAKYVFNHPLDLIKPNATLAELKKAEREYRRAILKMPDRDKFPQSLLSLAWRRGILKREYTILYEYLWRLKDTPENTERILEFLKYILTLDRRFANICHRELICCQYKYITPLTTALERQHGQPIVDLLKEYGAEIPGEALEPPPCD